MKTIHYYVLCIFCMSTFLCTSCNKDDNEPQTPTDDPKELQERSLRHLQESIVRVDSVGNVISRPLGIMLNEADTTILSVGVQNADEATKIFKSLFTEEQKFKQADQSITAEIADGSVTFTPVSGSHIVAQAIFDVPSLFHVSKIDFILQSAWPDNEGVSAFQYGDAVSKDCVTAGGHREQLTLMCIREYKSGSKGILVGKTTKRYTSAGSIWDSTYPASRSDANLVAGIISKDWAKYTALWNSKNMSLSDEYLWIGDSAFWKGRYAINLKYNNYDYWSIVGHHRAYELVVIYFDTIR